MPFDGTTYMPQPYVPEWYNRLQRLADHTATLQEINLRFWEHCALGQALNNRLFKADGLQWGWDGYPRYDDGSGYRHGWTAIARFFEMTPGQARWLFTYRIPDCRPGCRPSPQEVARRIRAYCDLRWMAMAC